MSKVELTDTILICKIINSYFKSKGLKVALNDHYVNNSFVDNDKEIIHIYIDKFNGNNGLTYYYIVNEKEKIIKWLLEHLYTICAEYNISKNYMIENTEFLYSKTHNSSHLFKIKAKDFLKK